MAFDARDEHDEPPRDVLAAEEFELPGGDPALRPGPVRLPDDPSGIAEPHDVLAAEEFALPAGRRGAARASGADADGVDATGWGRLLIAGALAAVGALWMRRRASC